MEEWSKVTFKDSRDCDECRQSVTKGMSNQETEEFLCYACFQPIEEQIEGFEDGLGYDDVELY